MFYHLPQLLDVIAELNKHKTAVTMRELAKRDPANSPNLLVLRCDVERNLEHARDFAHDLQRIGIPATMFFHTRRECYDPEVFAEITGLGHEIGFHHECLDRCRGDFAAARSLFLREIERFRRDGVALATVCMHGENGIARHGYHTNLDLFAHFPSLLEEAGVAESYLTIGRRWLGVYVSDTLRGKRNFWPLLAEAKDNPAVIKVLVHPHRWHNSVWTSLAAQARDLARYGRNKILGKRSYDTIDA